MSWTKEEMAQKVISFFSPGDSVNLGIGLPSLVGEQLSESHQVMLHSENGVLGVHGRPLKAQESATLINAGKETIAIKKGASFFDSALSFGMIRGGHIDFAVLGGMEVDLAGNLANWMIPGKKITGMGGAMDLVHGAKKVIVMMSHFTKNNKAKLVKSTQLPLTGANVVHYVVTDLCIVEIVANQLKVLEMAPGIKEADLSLPTP